MAKEAKRLHRQFEALGRAVPPARGPIAWLLADRMRLVRIPVAFLLMIGGLLAVLPVFGLWMLPLGVMLLAVDIPFLRAPVAGTMIRIRRRLTLWRHR